MLQYKKIVFNPFSVNTIILWDETKSCAIIDAGNYNAKEDAQLQQFIVEQELNPVLLLNTHFHIDHVFGNKFCKDTWGIEPTTHQASIPFYENRDIYASRFGLDGSSLIAPAHFLKDGDSIHFGNTTLTVLYTPGHADGSLCFYNEKAQLLIAGDVLFKGSIGRTDLPTGDFDVLRKSIFTKLFTLPEETEVICGHGPNTTIGVEAKSNPFLH